MKKVQKVTIFILLLAIIISSIQLNAQNKLLAKVEFLNMPVLFKEGGKSYQQVVANYLSENRGGQEYHDQSKDPCGSKGLETANLVMLLSNI